MPLALAKRGHELGLWSFFALVELIGVSMGIGKASCCWGYFCISRSKAF